MSCFVGTDRENKLVDICFSLVSTALESKVVQDMDRDHRMQWVADQLKECGFPTMPVGSCWGRIIDPALVPAELKNSRIVNQPWPRKMMR